MKLTLATTHANTLFRYKIYTNSGIHLTHNPYHIIGYINHGSKRIQAGNSMEEIRTGELYYIGCGNYFTEDVVCPRQGLSDQTIFVITNELMRTITKQIITFTKLEQPHRVRHRTGGMSVATHDYASSQMREFLRDVNGYLRRHGAQTFESDHLSRLKFYGVVYLMMRCEKATLRPQLFATPSLRSTTMVDVVRANLFRRVTVGELAAQCGLTPSSFKRHFVELFGETPHRWIVKQRLAHARTLLCCTLSSVKSISERCGFVSESHFIRLFRSQYGATPADYRLRNRARN